MGLSSRTIGEGITAMAYATPSDTDDAPRCRLWSLEEAHGCAKLPREFLTSRCGIVDLMWIAF